MIDFMGFESAVLTAGYRAAGDGNPGLTRGTVSCIGTGDHAPINIHLYQYGLT